MVYSPVQSVDDLTRLLTTIVYGADEFQVTSTENMVESDVELRVLSVGRLYGIVYDGQTSCT